MAAVVVARAFSIWCVRVLGGEKTTLRFKSDLGEIILCIYQKSALFQTINAKSDEMGFGT